MNGAAESLLQEILQANQAQAAALRDLASRMGGTGGGGGGGSGGGTPAINQFGQSVATATMSFNPFRAGMAAMALGVRAASLAIGALTGATVGVTAILIDFGKAAASGKASMSAVTGALSGLPGVFGMVARAATFAADVQELNIATQQKLAASGASFGGSLTAIRTAAAGAYLSLDEFAAVVKDNGAILRTLGGDVQTGVNQFSKIQSNLMRGEFASNLASMGYSMQDAANLTMSYMRAQGSMNKSSLQDTNKVSAAVAQYAQELNFLSQLTGESREALQKKLEAETSEAQFAAFLATMAPEKADKLRQGIQMAMVQGGQGAVDAFKAMAMGLPPMTEAGRIYTATQQAGVKALEQYNNNANSASVSVKQSAELNRSILAKQIAQGAQDRQKLETVLRADALAGGELSKSFATATQMQQAFMKDGKMMTEAEIAAKLESMAAEQEKQETEAAGVQAQQKAVMDLTNSILAKLMPAFNFLLNVTLQVAQFLGTLFDPILNFGTDLFIKVIKPAFEEIFGSINPAEIMKPIKDFFKGLFGGEGAGIDFTAIKNTIVKIVKPIADFAIAVGKAIDFEAIGATFRSVFGKIGNLFTALSGLFNKVFGGGDGAGFATTVGTALTKIFTTLGDVVGGIIDVITAIVESPVGTFLMETLKNLFIFFGERIQALVDWVSGIVDIVKGVIALFQGDFSKAWELIGGGFKKLWNSIVDQFAAFGKLILGTLSGVGELLAKAFKGIFTSVVDGVKNLGKGIWNFITGKEEETPAAPPARPPAAPARPAATSPTAAQTPAPTPPPARPAATPPAAATPPRAATAQPAPRPATPPPSPEQVRAAEAQRAATAEAQRSAATRQAQAATGRTATETAQTAERETSPIENLKDELTALNRVMIAYTRESLSLMRDNNSAIKALNKNLYPS